MPLKFYKLKSIQNLSSLTVKKFENKYKNVENRFIMKWRFLHSLFGSFKKKLLRFSTLSPHISSINFNNKILKINCKPILIIATSFLK